jgi:hypothetical protein
VSDPDGPAGFIVVAKGDSEWRVPEQVVRTDLGEAGGVLRRANRRAELAGRGVVYELAVLTSAADGRQQPET